MIDTTQVKEGMDVYDSDENKIGTVEFVQYTDEDYSKPGPETASTTPEPTNEFNIFKSFAKALTGEEEIPEEVRRHLERTGYIRLETGNIFESDYYVSLKNVSAIVGNNVHLSTKKDDMLAV